MPNRLRNLKVDYVSMVARPANQAATFVLAKHDPTPKENSTVPKLEVANKATAATAANPDPDHDGDDDRTASGDTDNSHFNADGTKKAMTKAAETVTISKAEFTALQDQNTKILKALEEQTAARQTAEAVAKAEQDARELVSAIAKAEKDLPALPGATSAEIGALLRDVSKAIPAAAFAKLEEILKAANVAIAKGDLFKEAGSSASGTSTSGGASAMDQIQTVAKGLVEKDAALTPAKSIAKAMELRPDLVLADRKERGFA
jgi:hypothetical protein